MSLLGPNHKRFFLTTIQIWWKIHIAVCKLVTGHQITTKFCTCHHNADALSNAKFCGDHFMKLWSRAKRICQYIWIVMETFVKSAPDMNDLLKLHNFMQTLVNALQIFRAANQYGTSGFCTDFTCQIREYEFGLQNTEIELCQFCHIKYCCQNKAYLFWVANQSRFVVFYAWKPSNASLRPGMGVQIWKKLIMEADFWYFTWWKASRK